jgi:hypothetical protein
MSGSGVQLTAQAIADSLGLRLSDPTLLSLIEEIGASHISSFLSQVLTICHATRSALIQEQHLQMVLAARRLPPLFGYSAIPVYSVPPAAVEQTDVTGVSEIPCALSEVAAEPVPRPPHSSAHSLRWVCVDGYSPTSRLSPRKRDAVRAPKPIERATSTPNLPAAGHPDIPRALSALSDLDKPPCDARQSADDVLSANLQQFFITFVNLLRPDSALTLTRALEQLAMEDQAHTLIPYFLQFAFAKFTEELQEPRIIFTIVNLTIAIARNPFIDIVLFTHPLLKIAFTGILAVSMSDAQMRDFPIHDRAVALLKVVCNRSKFAFPGIYEAVTNQLLAALFSPSVSLMTHLGALIAIVGLGPVSLSRFGPHIPAYLRIVKSEVRSRDARHKLIVPLLLSQIREAIERSDCPDLAQKINENLRNEAALT